MADILQQNDLSIGAFNQTQTGGAIPTITPSGSRPADVIGRNQALQNQITTLQFPQDMPKHYMGFQIHKYARQSLMAVAQNEMISQLVLPLPEQLADMSAVEYDQARFSATIGNIVNGGMSAVNNIQSAVAANNNLSLGNAIGQQLQDAKYDATVTGVGIDAGNAAFGESFRALMGAAGYAPNYFLTVVLNGPRYKEHTFSWTMAPRTPGEATKLMQIIRAFKDAQAPGLALGGALFSFPRVFKNYFAPNPGFLYQFKPSVLVGFQVNYAPGGAPSMKMATSGTGGWNAPTALKISAKFLELEFWLRSDYGDPNDPFDAQANSRNTKPGPKRED